MERSWNYILENFVLISIDSQELLQLDVDDFFTIINDELLNVKVCMMKSIHVVTDGGEKRRKQVKTNIYLFSTHLG